MIINDNQVAKRDGDLSKEDHKKLQKLEAAEEKKKILEEAFFEAFITISKSFKETMLVITDKIQAAKIYDW